MNNKQEEIVSVEVVIQLIPNLSRFLLPDKPESKKLKNLLDLYLGNLKENLFLQINFKLVIQIDESNIVQSDIYSINIMIDGKFCRVQVPIRVSKDVSAENLARIIINVICENRELLITPSLVNRILIEWTKKIKAFPLDFSLNKMHLFLIEFLYRGNSLIWAKKYLEDNKMATDSIWDTEDSFNKAITRFETTRIVLFLGKELYKILNNSEFFQTMRENLRDGIFYERGVILPPIELRKDKDLKYEYQLQLNDLKFPPKKALKINSFLVNGTIENLKKLDGFTGASTLKTIVINRQKYTIISNENNLHVCENHGYQVWDTFGYIFLEIIEQIKHKLNFFIFDPLIFVLLIKLKLALPALIEGFKQSIGTKVLRGVIRDLVTEEITIRDLRGILEALMANHWLNPSKISKPTPEVSQLVRLKFSSYISHKYAVKGNHIKGFNISSLLESKLLEKKLTHLEKSNLIKSITQLIKNDFQNVNGYVILTDVAVRKSLKLIIEKEFPNIPVLAFQEISKGYLINTINTISCLA